ncbi:MAG TPA: PhzF family phenazine biosynthesis protein [Candidatus Limnocylindria bacterium]
MRHEYALLDVFTDRRFGGNQLAVFHDGWGVSDADMQAVARELNFSETVFIAKPEQGGDHKLRIFTPARELPFAGHPTIGTAFFLADGKDADLRLEEGVGTLTVTVTSGFVEMEQPAPTFGPELDAEKLFEDLRDAIGIASVTAEPRPQVVSSGNPFLFVAVDPDEIADLSVNVSALNSLLTDVGAMGLYAFTDRRTALPDSRVHGRMFAPGAGVAEDPATGSAAGPLAAYLVCHGMADPGERIVIEQGFEMGRPSLMYARVGGTKDRITTLHVGGRAVMSGGGWVEL